MSGFSNLQQRAMDIRRRYDLLNKQHGHQPWSGAAYAMGLTGDVGDLLKLAMAKENLRDVNGGGSVDDKLRHELGDCLWSLFVIAEHYGVDLEKAFLATMDELAERIAGGQE